MLLENSGNGGILRALVVLLEAQRCNLLAQSVLAALNRLEDKGEKVSEAGERPRIRKDGLYELQGFQPSVRHDMLDSKSFCTYIHLDLNSCLCFEF